MFKDLEDPAKLKVFEEVMASMDLPPPPPEPISPEEGARDILAMFKKDR
jgi:hypothetical protein